MSFALRTTPRPGTESVKVKICAHNYISTYTVIDFDAVERTRPGTIPGFLWPMLRRQAEKYDTSKPVPLPFGLRKLWTVEEAIPGEN